MGDLGNRRPQCTGRYEDMTTEGNSMRKGSWWLQRGGWRELGLVVKRAIEKANRSGKGEGFWGGARGGK